ncbi:CDP-glycerol glycerophosphotransferase family protein [Oceanobacillus kimchii]|uniref:CDP-glycerol glycerophosphotransferase family protein n=1 Tax=Oceanobacillus kimchii TaxID=746691 RepID=UPI0021A8A346|nr:CDP-glycerol glycerophosphotransferase family protein [Oceanobacillus kimchii]MCT1579226.1 CDP-glycerol glycerophosphotransferase family protein [Oceanobacillus kimchii]MCT2134642.1 CDP-glycerol glycerophosphotransferase family protein [Oceanobacillus kimchii]
MEFKALLKKIYIHMYKFFFRLTYNIFSSLNTVEDNKLVISLYRTEYLEGNLKYVHDEILRQFPEAKIHLVSYKNKMNLKLFKEAKLLANARYLILDDYYLPIYLLKPNNSLKVIQLWHAAGALKKFGYSTIGTKFGPTKEHLNLIPIHSNYTHVYVSSSNIIDYYAEAFNMSRKRIYPIGIPRIDQFNDIENKNYIVKKILEENNEINDNKINILIAPTYRANKIKQSESSFDLIEFISLNRDSFKQEIRFIIKAHPYMNTSNMFSRTDNKNMFFLASNNYSINDWMLISDAFITDYSSSVFEFALLQKPIAHLVPDKEEYLKNRGLYQELRDISDGSILNNNTELISWVNARTKHDYFNTDRMVNINFDNTKEVSNKIVKHFLNN